MHFEKVLTFHYLLSHLRRIVINYLAFRLMTPFFKALQKMHKDHITAVLGEGIEDDVYTQFFLAALLHWRPKQTPHSKMAVILVFFCLLAN